MATQWRTDCGIIRTHVESLIEVREQCDTEEQKARFDAAIADMRKALDALYVLEREVWR